jgi:ABC-2 type transport system permease protein/lipopolysaccharide transport system permease protein
LPVISLDVSERSAVRPIVLVRPVSPTVRAARDLTEGLVRWWLWGLVAWCDIKQRYRGSALGPFWLTLSTAVMIGAMGMLYSRLFHMEIATYLPYLSLGILTWGLISSLLTESCTAFMSADHVIKQIRMPLSVHLYRVIARNGIVFGHNLVVFVVVAIWFQVRFGWADLMVVPGMALLTLGVIPAGLILAAVCARFRDIPQVVASLLQVIFFMTPIMWRPELLGSNIGLALYNPFNCFIDLIRSPLLGEAPSALSWMIAAGATVCLWLVAFPFFARFRARIAYWV